MDAKKRMVVNTIAQYLRSVINTLLSLLSTRIIMQALGVYDFGIYAVIGGVVALIGFINNALSITTQRYISYYFNKKDKAMLIFKNSMFIHLVLSVLLLFLLVAFTEPVINGILEIDASRLDAAKAVYIIVSVILTIGILTSPFRAMLIAHENIVYMSIIDVCDGVLKLLFAIMLLYVPFDKLIMYGFIMLFMQSFNLIAFAGYSLYNYQECSIKIHKNDLNRNDIKKLTGFMGWTTYSMGVIVGRNQGIAILINNFFGVIANTAYGIANQVYASVAFIATSVLNAMNPQIMKAEGEGKREKMLHLATLESKYSTALLLLFFIPVIFEMEALLNLWLPEVPENAVMFCQMILIAFICDQLTYGLNTANQATGHIHNYIILIYTPKLILIAVILVCLLIGGTAFHVMLLYLLFEILSAILRIPYLHYTCGLNVVEYIKNVFVRLSPLVIFEGLVSWEIIRLVDIPFRFVLTGCVAVLAGIVASWTMVLDAKERESFRKLIHDRVR